jgi:hypothetical protein
MRVLISLRAGVSRFLSQRPIGLPLHSVEAGIFHTALPKAVLVETHTIACALASP